jgi:uncharacterized membrane protein
MRRIITFGGLLASHAKVFRLNSILFLPVLLYSRLHTNTFIDLHLGGICRGFSFFHKYFRNTFKKGADLTINSLIGVKQEKILRKYKCGIYTHLHKGDPMTTETNNSIYSTRSTYSARNLWSGLLFGLGLVAFIDEVIFHQLLHWHHFYDKSTTDIGLVSDGLFHAFSWFATIGSSFMFADLRRRNALWLTRWGGGILLGAGAFQLYDGTIQHKLMRLHQIRYHVDILPYDFIWNFIAIGMLLAGIILVTRKGHRSDLTEGTT